VHNVSDVRQIEVQRAEPLEPGPSHLEVDTVIEKLKKYKLPDSDEIPVSIIVLLYQFTKRVTKVTNYRGIALLSTSYKISSNNLLSRIHHSSSTREKMGVQYDSTSAIYRVQESP
jgi:hypothetical protein